MIAPDWLFYTLAFLCVVFFAASVLIADWRAIAIADWRAIAIATEQRRIDAMNALNGDDSAIARIEDEIGILAKHPPRGALKRFLSEHLSASATQVIDRFNLNSTYGKFGFGPIDRINTMSFYPDHNKPINKLEPEMHTARHQFNTIQEARAFFAKARANRQTRHGYYQCADTLRARLNQHSRFVIGTEFMQ